MFAFDIQSRGTSNDRLLGRTDGTLRGNVGFQERGKVPKSSSPQGSAINRGEKCGTVGDPASTVKLGAVDFMATIALPCHCFEPKFGVSKRCLKTPLFLRAT